MLPKNMSSRALRLGTGSFLSNSSESGLSAKMPGLASGIQVPSVALAVSPQPQVDKTELLPALT